MDMGFKYPKIYLRELILYELIYMQYREGSYLESSPTTLLLELPEFDLKN